MKYKNLTREQLIISFDRLTRFKPTKVKYFRVFSDIILANLIDPVYRKQDLMNMPASEVREIAECIINGSIKELKIVSNSSISDSSEVIEKNLINEILKNYENSVFINDEETQEYLNNNIDYNSFIQLIDESCPINLRWLKALLHSTSTPLQGEEKMFFSNNNLSSAERVLMTDLVRLRQNKGLKFPICKVILAEGITEEILLPEFSKYLGLDFYKEGIQIIAAGGKNQVVKMYYKLIEELKIPIFVLLDKDAEENINQIKPKLRDTDKIHLVSCGEFEDLLPKSLIIKTVNNELNNFASITEDDFDLSISNAKNLELIFKEKGLHEFKKADFAKFVKDSVSEDSDISAEIASIVMEIGL